MDNSAVAADQFKLKGTVINIREYGSGNINTTFLVTLDSAEDKHFILQRINTQVFQHPELIMQNMRTITEHVRNRLQPSPPDTAGRWEMPCVLLTKDARDHWIAPDGEFWRAISFIDEAETFDTITDIKQAKEAGYALGMFHNLLSDLPSERLSDTLEGFHITPRYLRHYNGVRTNTVIPQSPELNYCLQFIHDRTALAHVLENARGRGILNLRPIHGDPKINNIMMDTATGHAVSIVDLDTVKPGLIHYDIGDCIRSGCNPLGEETELWETVRFNKDFCEAILQGYLSKAGEFLVNHDYEYLYESIRLLPFELGLRFFTDFLEGNIYFKASRQEHNLARALVQFKLTESIESQEADIRAIIRDQR